MLFLKVMYDDGLPDTSRAKSFKVIQLEDDLLVDFFKESPEVRGQGDFNEKYLHTARVMRGGEVVEQFALKGTAYLMTERGATIATYQPIG
jgi:hypothetical protein